MTRIDAGTRMAGKILPVFATALLSAMAGCWAAGMTGETLFLRQAGDAREMVNTFRSPGQFSAEKRNTSTLSDFAAGDPFNAPAASAGKVPPGEPESEITVEELYELEGIRIVGTIPGISAWVAESGRQMVFLVGQKVKGHDLLEVGESRVVLRKGDSVVSVLLRYSGQEQPSPSAAGPRPPQKAARKQGAGVLPARPGQQGSIPRETVDNLLMNPLDEMKKFRLRPKFEGDKALGVEVQWMDRNSFLESVGVQKGDVIQNVNGLEIRNMGDVVNVINSIMGGSAFDVQVIRGGQPVSLKYNIR